MTLFPEQPVASVIERRDEFEGVVLFWPTATLGPVRYIWVAFSTPFLLAWLAGLVMVTRQLLRPEPDLTLLLWLAAWGAGGAWAPYVVWMMLRPGRPESVLLGDTHFEYDKGWAFASPEYIAGLFAGTESVFPGKADPVSVPKAEAAFALDLEPSPNPNPNPGEGRRRLTFRRGDESVEIGRRLPKPDREWLFTVLENWRQGRI